MAPRIQHKRSSTASNPPTAAQLEAGEIAINTASTTANIHFEDADGVVRSVGADPGATGLYGRRVSSANGVGTWESITGSGATGDIGFWTRSSNTLSPVNSGDLVVARNYETDDYDITSSSGTGCRVGTSAFSFQKASSVSAGTYGQRGYWGTTQVYGVRADGGVDVIGTGTIADPNISLSADGSCSFAGDNVDIRTNGQIRSTNGFLAYGSNLNSTPFRVTTSGDGSSGGNVFSVENDGTTSIIGTGTTAAPNISLKADGSASFTGNIDSGAYDNTSSTVSGTRVLASGGIRSQRESTNVNNNVYLNFMQTTPVWSVRADGRTQIGGTISTVDASLGSPNIDLRASNGQIEAADDIISRTSVRATDSNNVSVGLYFGTDAYERGALSIRGNVNGQQQGIAWRLKNDAGSFRHDFLTCHANRGWEFYTKNSGADFDGTETPVITFARNGGATFTGTITGHQGTVQHDETPAIFQRTKDTATVSQQQSVIFAKHTCRGGASNTYTYWKASSGGNGTTDHGMYELYGSRGSDTALADGAKIKLAGNGNGTFTGVVEANGGFTENGNPISFSDINAARETFQELRLAVQDADNFESLRQAMLVALDRWSPANSAAFS